MVTRIIYSVEKILVSALTGVLSYKAINSEPKEDEVDSKPYILSFFIFLGFLNLFEVFIEPLTAWLPFFQELKCILLFVVFVLTVYKHSDILSNTLIVPFYTFFDSHITPKLIRGCDLMLYYVVVMLSPFIHQENLEKMRSYSIRIIEETNKKIIQN